MMAFIERFLTIRFELPILFWGASAFYVSSVIVLAVPYVRRKFVGCFQLSNEAGYLTALDSFRGFAALWVACFHSMQWLPNNIAFAKLSLVPHGNSAVPVFFILSGFVVWRSLKRKLTKKDGVAYFLKRRFFRIYPLYFASIVVINLIASRATESLSHFQAFLQEVLLMGAISFIPALILPLWSLHLEMLLYLLLPSIALVAGKKIFPVSIVLTILLFLAGHNPHPMAVMKFFFIGMIVYEVYERKVLERWGKVGPLVSVAFGLWILSWNCYGNELAPSDKVLKFLSNLLSVPLVLTPTEVPMELGVGFSLLILGVLHSRFLSQILSFYPFRFVGVISYSIFVWHAILIIANTQLTFLPNAVLGGTPLQRVAPFEDLFTLYIPAFIFYSAVSFALIERPFLKIGLGKIRE